MDGLTLEMTYVATVPPRLERHADAGVYSTLDKKVPGSGGRRAPASTVSIESISKKIIY